MRESSKVIDNKIVNLIEFTSISDLASYIKNAKPTSWFEGRECSLEISDKRTKFTKTKSFEEAMSLLENGWYEEAQKIEKELNLKNMKMFEKDDIKFIQSVAGFHPIVPNYLMGLPNSMVSSKIVSKKQKVVTLNLSISFSFAVSTKEIEEVCLKAFRIVKEIESKGCRVNFNVFYSGKEYEREIGKANYCAIKLRVKSANERLNVSKVCFPVIHPSMLRRIMFRVVETNEAFTKRYTVGYGMSVSNGEFVEVYKDIMKGEYLIPTKIYGNSSSTKAEDMYDNIIKI